MLQNPEAAGTTAVTAPIDATKVAVPIKTAILVGATKRQKKIKAKANRKVTKAEKKAADKLACCEAVIFDSPALAAVKRLFS